MSSPTPASRSKTRYSPTTVRQSTNYGTPQPPNHSLTRTLRTRLPIPTPKPQNDRRKPLRHTLHHQTRLPHFHQTKRLRRTLTIPKRHHPHSHRLRSRFPRLSARRPVPKGIRGIMHALRRTAHYHGSRVNMISPWFVVPSHPHARSTSISSNPSFSP
jgi:hypothetical protein